MARQKYAPGARARRFYVEGLGYLTRDEYEFVLREAKAFGPFVVVGLIPQEEARQRIRQRLAEYRAAKRLRG